MRSAAVLGLMAAVLFPLPAQGCGESTAPRPLFRHKLMHTTRMT